MAEAILKRCPKCDLKKPIDAFYKAGQAGYCIACEKAYKRAHYLKNAERIKAKTRTWVAANPERKASTDAAWRKANPERCAEKSRDWTAKNPEKRRQIYTASRQRNLSDYRGRESAYRDAHRDECNARIKAWKKLNPHAIVAYAGKRRAAAIRALPAWSDLSKIAAIYAEARRLGQTVDHAVPLISPVVCGLHCEANLQVIPGRENFRKNNRYWPDMWG